MLMLVASSLGCATAKVTPMPPPVSVFDVHAHLEPSSATGRIDSTTPGTIQALLAQMGRAHVAKAAVIAVSDGQPDSVVRANDALWTAAHAHPSRLVPVGTLPSGDLQASLAEIDRLAQKGFRAVRVVSPHPMNADALQAQVARAASHGMVVLLDGWGWDPHVLARLALAEPKAKLVVAHLGGVRFSGMLLFATLAHYRFYAHNVWFDLSSVAPLYAGSPYASALRWVVRKLGVNRMLYGSDFPLVSERKALSAFRALGFTPDESRRILECNAEALFAGPTAAH